MASVRDYHTDVLGYTHGKGIFSCSLSGYAPCHNAEEIIEKMNYNAESDVENSADSVFCEHGSGFVVKWNEIGEHMHLPGIDGLNYGKVRSSEDEEVSPSAGRTVNRFRDGADQDKELMAIFEMAYGKPSGG